MSPINPEPPDELLDCFDEQGKLIGTFTRKDVHVSPPLYWHRVVNIWLVNQKNEILCSKRSETLSGNPGKWQTYFGGHLQAGNSFKEEVGLLIDPQNLFFVAPGMWEPSKHFSENYIYPFSGKDEDLRFPDGEITEVKWFTIEEYLKDREENPDKWCNGISPANQEKIQEYFRTYS